jgi:hypothetical protein
VGSRLGALQLGPPLHVAADQIRHQDIADRRFEIVSGLVFLGVLAACRGPFDPITLGAASSSAPDLEHIVPWLHPAGRSSSTAGAAPTLGAFRQAFSCCSRERSLASCSGRE